MKNDPRIDHARNNIKVAISLRNTNKAEVSRACGLSRNALGQFLSGRTQTMSFEHICKVCDVLGIYIGALHIEDGVTASSLLGAQKSAPDEARGA